MTDDDKKDIPSSEEKGVAKSTLGGAVACGSRHRGGHAGGGFGDWCRVWRRNGRSQETR
jgi:hypothetical protein